MTVSALCRSGIGNIILIDLDDICISNTNRQIHATSKTIGKLKIDQMKERLTDINPTCNITLIHDFVTVDNAYAMVEKMKPDVDIILDAIDGSNEKVALIVAACVHDISIVTSGGAAGRIDPTQIVCDDLTKSKHCRLLHLCKHRLRDEYKLFSKGPPTGNIKSFRVRKWHIPAVFSSEQQNNFSGNDDNTSSLRRCDGALGTACFVTGTYGFVAASKVVSMIANNELKKPRALQSSVRIIKQMHEQTGVSN